MSLTSTTFTVGVTSAANIDSRYRNLSLKFYTTLMSYADDLEAVSVDEALIDVTSTFEHVEASQRCESIKAYAESIRAKVREETGCESLSSLPPPLLIFDADQAESKHRNLLEYHPLADRISKSQTRKLIPPRT
jgi:hypothetical protein